MIIQHVRRQKRAEGGLLTYSIVAVYFSIIILRSASLQIWIKAAAIIVFTAIALLLYFVEARKGTFNKVKMSEYGIEIFTLGNSKNIEWKEVSSVRLLPRYMDLKNGLEERYYGIYYMHDGEECKELISYNNETDREIRKYYKEKFNSTLD